MIFIRMRSVQVVSHEIIIFYSKQKLWKIGFILLYKSLYTVGGIHNSDASKNDMAPYLLRSGRPTNADLVQLREYLSDAIWLNPSHYL